jgi:hypothetical protein
MAKRHATTLAAVGMALAAGCTQPAGPELGEIMTLTQMRHAKIWFAGQAQNWPLVDYELDELQEGFDDVVKFHPTHKDAPLPLSALVPKMMDSPIKDLRQAAKAGDLAAFTAAYDALTAACNSCHEATNFGFNVVQRPTQAWFGNQSFAPRVSPPAR